MSLEGMWAIYFGDFGGVQINSGIAVFETGRIFGGDSMMAYLGSYAVKDQNLSGQVKIWAYNPHQIVTTAFGKTGTPEGEILTIEGNFDPEAGQMGEVTASLWEADNLSMKIPAKLVKVADLPN